MSKFGFVKTAANKVVEAAKAVDHAIVDPVQSKVTETYTEHKQMKAAKEVMRDQILMVGKHELDKRAIAKAAAKEAEEAARLAKEMESAGLVYTDAYAEAMQAVHTN